MARSEQLYKKEKETRWLERKYFCRNEQNILPFRFVVVVL